MIKVIVSGGCSFAYGFGLTDRNKRYSFLLAEQQNAELIDVSVSGGSNENISTATAYGINTALKKYNPQEIVVVVGWTHIQRMEYWRKDIARFHSAHLIHYHNRGDTWSREVNKFVVEKMWEPCFSYYRLVHAFNYVNTLCKANNINLINLHNLQIEKVKMPRGIIHNSPMLIENYVNGVMSEDIENKFNVLLSAPSFCSLPLSKKREYRVSSDDYHPSDLAHKIWAEQILNNNREIFQ